MNKEKSTKISQLHRGFEQFRNKRTQKTQILHCQWQSTASKIKCFEELLKLTHKGTTLKNNTNNQVPYTICKSHKNLGQKLPQVYPQENTELLAVKLEQMVQGVKQWTNSKNTSKYPHQQPQIEEKYQMAVTEEGTKFKKIHYKSAAISRIKYTPTLNTYISYNPSKKHSKIKRASQPNSQKGHSTTHSVSNLTSINPTLPDFTSLRTKITQYQHKARNKYGIKFEIIRNNEQEQAKEAKQESKKNEMIRVVSMTEIKKQANYPYFQLVKQATKDDPCVPQHFLGLIRSISGKPRQPYPKNITHHRYIRV